MLVDYNNNYTVHDKMSLDYNILDDDDDDDYIHKNWNTKENDNNNLTFHLMGLKDNNIDRREDNTWMNEPIDE